MDYSQELTNSFRLIKKRKYLIVFGFLIALFSGNSNGININSSGNNNSFESIVAILENIRDYFLENWWMMIVFGAAAIALAIIGYIVSGCSKIAIIRSSTNDIQDKEDPKPLELFSEAFHYLGKKFVNDLVIGAGMFVVIGGLGVIAFFVSIATFGLGMLPIICCGIPFVLTLMIFVTTLSRIAFWKIVVQDMNSLDSLSSAFEMIKAKFKELIVASLVSLVPGLIMMFLYIPLLCGALTIVTALFVTEQYLMLFLAVGAMWFVSAVINSPVIAILNVYWPRIFWKLENPSEE